MEREVTRDEFLAAMNPLNVHPRPMPDITYWEMQDGTRRLFGKTTPGYLCEGRKTYYLI